MKFLILLALGYYILRRYINVPLPGSSPKVLDGNDNKDNDDFVDYEELK